MTSVNIIYIDNGLGLSRDFRLLASALQINGCDVVATALGSRDERWRRKQRSHWIVRSRRWWRRATARSVPKRFDINLMLEHLWPAYFDDARHNVALPNPEWFDRHDLQFLRDIDMVWAKTQNAVGIYERLNCTAFRVGFASDDRFDPGIARERKFLHLAGGSRTKGTRHTMDVWARHPEWPGLTVLQDPREAKTAITASNISHRIEFLNSAEPDGYAKLRQLQNGHAFHLCLSETDAWGHYLVEALGVAAVTLATDAPPMNELVAPERGVLVPYATTGRISLATTYQFDEQAFATSVERALALSDAELQTIGARAREWFLENNRTFPARIGAAVDATLRQLRSS